MKKYNRLTTKYVCGIDLHAKTMTLCIMDLNGKILKRKTIPCIFEELMETIKPWASDISVGVESTYNWYWIIDLLKKYTIPCCLGHALYIKRQKGSKHKNDKADARCIADLLRQNQFPLAYPYPKEMRTVRDLLRRRHFLVRKRASTFTHFQNSLHQDGCIEPLRNKLQYKSTRNSLVNLTNNNDLKIILNTDLAYIASLDQLILDLDKIIVKRARYHNRKYLDALQTIPGCGDATALTVLYEMHTIDRFRSPQAFSSYSRVVRADNESNGKNLGRTTNDKIGNPYLKWAISQIGQSMIMNYPKVQQWHAYSSLQYGKARAHARLRHKISVAIYNMLKRGTVFDMDQFLRGLRNRKENPAHNWTETSGRKSEPTLLIEHPSGSSQKRKSATGRSPLRTTGRRKVLRKA